MKIKVGRYAAPLLALTAACAPGDPAASAPDGPVTAVVGVHVIPMTADTMLSDHTVLIAGERVAAIGPRRSVRVPRGARVIDGAGRYLLPGMWDMHTHTLSGTADVQRTFAMLLAKGVAGVRDMGAPLDTILAVRRRVEEGSILAPRMIVAGPLVDGPRQPWSIPFPVHVETAAEASAAVDMLTAEGVDFIKVYGSLPREAFFAAADAARRIGLPFAGHVPFALTASEVSDAGQASIEHAFLDMFAECVPEGTGRIFTILGAWGRDGYDALYQGSLENLDARDPTCTAALLARLHRNGTRVVPTTVNTIKDRRVTGRAAVDHLSPEARDACEATVRMIEGADAGVREAFFRQFVADIGAMHDAGIELMAGTDFFNACIAPGFSLHDELEHFVEAGLTPFEALRTATVNPARFMGREDVGSLRPGVIADLVLLEGNPLADIRNTRSVAATALGGRWLTRAEIDEMMREAH
jgi:imidazolonepropionase-like amidohydrolase